MSEGWGKPILSRKFHYFRDSLSLCRKWMFTPKDLEQGKDEHSQNCKTCQKKRLKEIEKNE